MDNNKMYPDTKYLVKSDAAAKAHPRADFTAASATDALHGSLQKASGESTNARKATELECGSGRDDDPQRYDAGKAFYIKFRQTLSNPTEWARASLIDNTDVVLGSKK
ncbi:hypothetical protein C8J56DRAFT_1067331 [Mycena floridula]|nr:hypothetical protein C8J56DRAFT_1070779 [Mycena floridula]KAJ7572985.1 hypothetical protein C8J56DRAFT_1067331 [Mycena floridula]